MDLLKINKVLGIFCIFIVVALTVNQFLPQFVNGEAIVRRDNSNLAAKALADTNSNNDSILNYDSPIQINEANESEEIDFGIIDDEMLLLESESSSWEEECEMSNIETNYLQGFELDFVYQFDVDYAHPDYYSRETSTTYVKEGTYSLEVTPDSNGQNYDGLQANLTFIYGSIEAWFYPKSSNVLIPSLWLRTSNIDHSLTYCSFDTGYVLRLYVDTVYLLRRDANSWTTLDTYYLGEYISNKWWHMKFEITDSILKAWVTKSNDFTSNPQFSYDTSGDGIRLYEGKPGISVRTSMPGSTYKTYVDAVNINYYEVYDKRYESFEPEDPLNLTVPCDGIDYAHINYYSLSTERHYGYDDGSYSLKATPDSNGQNYDGIQFNETFAEGSIEARFYPKSSNVLIPSLWLRTSNIDHSLTYCSFDTGYALLLYIDTVYLQRRDSVYGWTTLDTYYLGEYISNKWWHMKFEATGSILKGWITKYNDFASNPQFNYNTSDDSIRFYSGKAGISVRTSTSSSIYQTFVDAVKIKAITSFLKSFEYLNGVYSAYCPSEMLYYDLLTDTGISNLYNDMQYWLSLSSWKLIEMIIVNQEYKQINGYTYEITTDIIEFDMWSSREMSTSSGEIEDFINTDNIYVNNEESEADGFAIEYYKFFDALENSGDNWFWLEYYGLITAIGLLIRGLCALGTYILEKLAIETLTINIMTFGYGAFITTITIEVSAIITLLELVNIALIILAALYGILYWVLTRT